MVSFLGRAFCGDFFFQGLNYLILKSSKYIGFLDIKEKKQLKRNCSSMKNLEVFR